MICGAADEGSAALFVCGGTDLTPAPWHLPHRRARQVPRRRSQILGLEDGRRGLDLPGGQIGVRLLCGRGEGLDSPVGRIGVSLLTGAKFGDRMKKIFSEFFVLDFMRTEKFREDIV